jgi:heptosyltransferase-2
MAPSVDATGRFDLRRSMALLSLADLYVGNDSGPMNLAAAMGVRAFGLFGASIVNNSPRIEPIVRDRFFPGMRGISPTGAAEQIGPALAGLGRGDPARGRRR